MHAKKILFVSLFHAILYAGNPFNFSGCYKSFFFVLEPPTFKTSLFNASHTEGYVTNRLRSNILFSPGATFRLQLSYELVPEIKKKQSLLYNALFSLTNPSVYRAADFKERLYPFDKEDIENFSIYHNLDRFSFSFQLPFTELIAGRQAIGWGSARIINPTDILTPFGFNALDTEERYGIDAVRMIFPIKSLNEIDIGYVFGDEFHYKNSAFFLRTKIYVLETDIAFPFIGFRGNLLSGIDIARSLGGAGIWCEAAHVFTDVLDNETEHSNDNDYFRLSLGADYNFSEKFYGYIEYHFNSIGSNNADSYLNQLTTCAYTEGAVYLLGKHYCGLGGRYEITPLLPGSFMVLYNFSDNSVCLLPELEYNIRSDIYISLGAIIGLGKKAESPFAFNSEFGIYPDAGYISLRIYF